MQWDIFCRVIDNFGDIGVCWRLAADLGSRGESVRLWVDDASALVWMAPHGAAGVALVDWSDAVDDLAPGDVVVEAFGCDPPPAFVARMTNQVWINLEYLSAQDYVERSHGLASPRPGGHVKWFFYPGFTQKTGGLIREPELMAKHMSFDRDGWLAALGIMPLPGETLISLFCYDGAPIDSLVSLFADRPALVLAAQGAAQRQKPPLPPTTRWHELPWLAQPDFDRLLWSCDLNIVRGEDSFVRAQWAGAPFIWHIYPQHDHAHAAKLGAFLDRIGADAATRQLWRAWNGLAPWPQTLPQPEKWADACNGWREKLLAQDDLATQLLRFVRQKG